jgi:Zn-dependent protease with chaperone function
MLLAVLLLVFFTWLVFASAASVLSSAASPLVERVIRHWAPEARHRALLVLAVAPVLLATTAVLAVMSPSVLSLVWPAFDHCLVHPGHVHLCFAHLPEQWGSPALLVGLTFISTFLAGKAAVGVRGLWRASRLGSRLVASAPVASEVGVRVLPTAQPLCLLVGLFRPSVLVSRGLLESIASDELRAVLRHERAHAQRHDTLVRLVAGISTVFMLPGARRALLQALELAAEQSSDEAGASELGDRTAMAEVILKVERLLHATPAPLSTLSVSFGGTSVPLRVAALLDAPIEKRPRLVPVVLVTLLGVALFAASPELHHATETLLGFIAH